MKPFDLMAALNGQPVVTRAGRPVTEIGWIPANDGHTQSVHGTVHEPFRMPLDRWFYPDGGWMVRPVGKLGIHTQDTEYDLFMADASDGALVDYRRDVRKAIGL